MKFIPKIIFVILTGVFIFSCTKKNEEISILHPEWKITSGTVCKYPQGWDSLVITHDTIRYVFKQSQETETKEYIALNNPERWNAIVETINIDSFSKLPYYTNNQANGGCDDFIAIKDDEGRVFTKYFDPGTQIDTLAYLQTEITNMMGEFGY